MATKSVRKVGGRRRRRSVVEARREILDAAEQLLSTGGPDAVRVQVVARAVGMSDAAVHYHFDSREGLVDALVRDVGRRMKAELGDVVNGWRRSDVDIRSLVTLLDEKYRVRGYARLTAWMRLSGWRPRGSGMFRPLAEAMHETRSGSARSDRTVPVTLEDSLHVVTLLNLVTWAEPLVGAEWRRSVGLPGTAQASEQFRQWFSELVQAHLDTVA